MIHRLLGFTDQKYFKKHLRELNIFFKRPFKTLQSLTNLTFIKRKKKLFKHKFRSL